MKRLCLPIFSLLASWVSTAVAAIPYSKAVFSSVVSKFKKLTPAGKVLIGTGSKESVWAGNNRNRGTNISEMVVLLELDGKSHPTSSQ